MRTNLILFDFDWTVIDCNSDTWIPEKLTPQIIPYFNELRNKNTQWTELMVCFSFVVHALTLYIQQMLLKRMSVEYKITIKQIRQCLTTCPIDPHMLQIFRDLKKMGNVVHIISDANTMFIDTILDHHGVRDCVASIISNPGVIARHERLAIEYLHVTKLCGETEETRHTCITCPINMCKGAIVEQIIKARNTDGVTVYVGDGGNDYCAVTKLSLDHDFVFARRDYALHQRLQKNGFLNGSKNVFLWGNWKELLELFRINGIIANDNQ